MRTTFADSADDLHRAAIDRTGLDYFGENKYLKGLEALLSAFDTDLKLTETGTQVLYEAILRNLMARLYSEKGWAETKISRVEAPLVIIGLPRTGTTALHRMLAVDPQFQILEFWLTEAPRVRPPRDTWQSSAAYRRCAHRLQTLYNGFPKLRNAHEIAAADPAECVGILTQDFVSNLWPIAYNLPTYADWLSSQSTQDSYERYARVLGLIGAGDVNRRWLLKSPMHMTEIDSLLQAFPDACIIHTHRDPLRTIPSLCDLV
jgi:hypothetical protein